MPSISVTVNGYPPAKNEAKSMLAAEHPYAERVIDLLRRAKEEVERTGWVLAKGIPLRLELVLRSPELPPSDATNYLGGVADVLEEKSRRGHLTHLDDLSNTCLYDNDRMITAVAYQWRRSPDVSYTVTVSTDESVSA